MHLHLLPQQVPVETPKHNDIFYHAIVNIYAHDSSSTNAHTLVVMVACKARSEHL